MKTEDLLILAAAGAAVYLILKFAKGQGFSAPSLSFSSQPLTAKNSYGSSDWNAPLAAITPLEREIYIKAGLIGPNNQYPTLEQQEAYAWKDGF